MNQTAQVAPAELNIAPQSVINVTAKVVKMQINTTNVTQKVKKPAKPRAKKAAQVSQPVEEESKEEQQPAPTPKTTAKPKATTKKATKKQVAPAEVEEESKEEPAEMIQPAKSKATTKKVTKKQVPVEVEEESKEEEPLLAQAQSAPVPQSTDAVVPAFDQQLVHMYTVEMKIVCGTRTLQLYGTAETPYAVCADFAEFLGHQGRKLTQANWYKKIKNDKEFVVTIDKIDWGCVSQPLLNFQETTKFLTEDGIMEGLFKTDMPIGTPFRRLFRQILKAVRNDNILQARAFAQTKAEEARVAIEEKKQIEEREKLAIESRQRTEESKKQVEDRLAAESAALAELTRKTLKTGVIYGFWHKKYKVYDYIGSHEGSNAKDREQTHKANMQADHKIPFYKAVDIEGLENYKFNTIKIIAYTTRRELIDYERQMQSKYKSTFNNAKQEYKCKCGKSYKQIYALHLHRKVLDCFKIVDDISARPSSEPRLTQIQSVDSIYNA